jgi:hypothetical protein
MNSKNSVERKTTEKRGAAGVDGEERGISGQVARSTLRLMISPRPTSLRGGGENQRDLFKALSPLQREEETTESKVESSSPFSSPLGPE